MPEVAKDDIEAVRKLMERSPEHKEDIRHVLYLTTKAMLLSSSPKASLLFAAEMGESFEESLSFHGKKTLSPEERTLALDVTNMAVLLESNTREELEAIKLFLEESF